MEVPDAQVASETRRWLERAVIGLNLCPFAKAVHVKQQVHYAVSPALGWNDLIADLAREAFGKSGGSATAAAKSPRIPDAG